MFSQGKEKNSRADHLHCCVVFCVFNVYCDTEELVFKST